MILCANCGKDLEAGVSVCSECGAAAPAIGKPVTALTSEADAAAPVTTTTSEPEAAATLPIESNEVATTPIEPDAADDEEDEDMDEAAPYQAPPTTPIAASKRPAASGGSSLPAKVLVAILILVFIGGAFIFIQSSSSKPRSFNLSKDDMKVLFQEIASPQKQQEIAANPDEKKKFVDYVKTWMAVAQVAENEGYGKRPEIQLQIDIKLTEAYHNKHPEFKATDEQVNAYLQAHPNDFDNFLQANPGLQQRAQGPQRETFKKQVGEFKLIIDLAHKERLDEDAVTRLLVSQILAGAYLNDLDKNPDKLISDADVEDYYKEHPSDFDEVRVRHVLISTQPKPDDQDADKQGDKQGDKKGADKDAKPKALSGEEARKKAQEVLDRARKGEDFAKLAEQYSDDPGSKTKGGEYDFFPRGQNPPEFENAAFALKPGEISEVVPTQYGFHVIKLEARRPGPPPSAPSVRKWVIDKLKPKKIDDRITEIAQTSKVEVPEDFEMTVKPAEMPAPMPGGAPPNQQQ